MKLPSGETGKFDRNMTNLNTISRSFKDKFSRLLSSRIAFCERFGSAALSQGPTRYAPYPWKMNARLIQLPSAGWPLTTVSRRGRVGKRRRNPVPPLWKAFTVISVKMLFVIHHKECLISPRWHIPSGVLPLTMGAFALTEAKIAADPTARHRFYSRFSWEVLKSQSLHEMWLSWKAGLLLKRGHIFPTHFASPE